MRNTIIEGDPWYFRQSLELFYSQVKPQWRLHEKKQLSNDKWNHIYISLYSFLPSAHVTKSIPSPWNRPLTWGHWESKINRQNSLQLLEWNCAVLTSCMVAAEQSHFSHKKQYSLIATNIQYCIKIFSHSSLLWVLFVEPLNADLWIIQA